MTYIYDMAGGTEYRGDDMAASGPVTAPARDVDRTQPEYRVELRLAPVESPAAEAPAAPVVYDIETLINSLKD